MMVIFRNLLILVNLVISGIFIDACESDGSGDSVEIGNSVESCDLLNLVIMKYLMNMKNMVIPVYSGDSGDFGESCESGHTDEF